MADAAEREHAREPDLAAEVAALARTARSVQAATSKLHAITRALLARVGAECDSGAVTQDAVCALTEIQARYEELRRACERNSAALERAAGSVHFAEQAFAAGVAAGEQRAAAQAGRARHARHARQDGAQLRLLGLAGPAAAGAWAALKAATRAHAKGAAASAMTAGVLTAGTLTLTIAPQPWSTPAPPAPQKSLMVLPASAPAPAAAVTLAPRPHRSRRRQPRPSPPAPAPAASAAPSPSPSVSQSPPVQGSVTGSAVPLGGGRWSLTLTAQDGPAGWSLTCTPGLTLSAMSGDLAAGESVTVTVVSTDPGAGGTVWLQPGGTAVQLQPPG